MGLAIISTLILFTYIFGAIKFANFDHHASFEDQEGVDKWFRGGLYQFMHVLPLSTRFFVGIQSINLACGQLKQPKRDVPRGSLGAITFCLFTSFAVLLLGVSLPPGLDAFINRPRPLTAGFQAMFALPRRRAALISLPATFMAGSAFMFYYGQQISAMGKSALLNPWFGKQMTVRNSPIVALCTGTVVSYCICIAMHHSKEARDTIYDLSVLAAMITYLSIFTSFVMFRWYFPTIQREFISPLGVPGAVYGFLVFLLTLISICGFQQDQIALIVFAVVLAVSSVYYYFVVSKREKFSDEEKTVMFKAYLIKSKSPTIVVVFFPSFLTLNPTFTQPSLNLHFYLYNLLYFCVLFSADNAAKATRVKRGAGRAAAVANVNISPKPIPTGAFAFPVPSTTSTQSHSAHDSEVALSEVGALDHVQEGMEEGLAR